MEGQPRGIVVQFTTFQKETQREESCQHVNDELVEHELASLCHPGGREITKFEKRIIRKAIEPLREHGKAKGPSEDARVARIVHCLNNGGLLQCILDRDIFGPAQRVWLRFWLEDSLSSLIGKVSDTEPAKEHRKFMVTVCERLAILLVTKEQTTHMKERIPVAA